MISADLDILHHSILKLDYFNDLIETEILTMHLEEDTTWEYLKDFTNINSTLEKVPISFSSAEEYNKIFTTLFLIEVRAQLARSKQCENNRFEFGPIFCHFLQSCATAKTNMNVQIVSILQTFIL